MLRQIREYPALPSGGSQSREVQMSRNDIVTIKSFRNGFDVILSPAVPFEELSAELGRRFGENRSFFGNVKKAISFKGRKLDEEMEDELLRAIRENSDIDVSCIIEEDEERNDIYLRAMKQFAMAREAARSQVIIGTVRSGEVIESTYGITILGDVNPGAKIVSGGCIVILGTLYGRALAGDLVRDEDGLEVVADEGESESITSDRVFVAALRMKPEVVSVNGIRAMISSRDLRVPLLSKSSARIAFERDGEVVIESINSEFISSLGSGF